MSTLFGIALGFWAGWLATYRWFKGKEEDVEQSD
jgi:hypothetical protein